MTTHLATGSSARMLTMRTNKPGYCLATVDLAILQGLQSIGPHAGQYPTAYSAWVYSTSQHPMPADGVVPEGLPILLGPSPTRTDADKNAGDVVISNGQPWGVVATDCPAAGGSGHIGTMTLQARAAQTARPILGYTTNFCGYDLLSSGTTPVVEAESMSYSIIKDANSATIYVCSLITGNSAGIGSTYHVGLLQRFKAGDPGMLDGERAICRAYIQAINPASSFGAATAAAWNPTDAQLATIAAGIKPAPTAFSITGEAKAA